jgi:hypothetical protein
MLNKHFNTSYIFFLMLFLTFALRPFCLLLPMCEALSVGNRCAAIDCVFVQFKRIYIIAVVRFVYVRAKAVNKKDHQVSVMARRPMPRKTIWTLQLLRRESIDRDDDLRERLCSQIMLYFSDTYFSNVLGLIYFFVFKAKNL